MRTALAVVGRYEAAIASGHYADARALLAPGWRVGLGEFSSERAAYFKTMGPTHELVTQPTDMAPLDQWVPNGASIDLAHAVLIEVSYPAHRENNAATELYIAQPGSGGGWELLEVR